MPDSIPKILSDNFPTSMLCNAPETPPNISKSFLIHISDGKMADVNVLDILIPEPGSYYVMDRGYVDFERLCALHVARAFFVTRAKSNLKIKRVYSAIVERETGVICDQRVVMTGASTAKNYPEQLR